MVLEVKKDFLVNLRGLASNELKLLLVSPRETPIGPKEGNVKLKRASRPIRLLFRDQLRKKVPQEPL